MRGSFIVSLDCEGKWGMADSLQPYHHKFLNADALALVYQRLVTLFGRYDVPATFAYVMAFTLTPQERQELRHLFARKDGARDDWLQHFWSAEEKGELDGWFQPRALDVVKADQRHEIGCHSFCHRPLDGETTDRAQAELELEAAEVVARLKGVELRTFIYPRNKVGYVDLLHRHGYLGYRAALQRSKGTVGRIASLAAEFNVLTGPQATQAPCAEQIVRIPAGYFFNWRYGARRWVPGAVTVKRWKNILKGAAKSGGVAHLWLHPHNLITAPETWATLEQVLAAASDMRDRDRLDIVTQENYCRRLLGTRRENGY